MVQVCLNGARGAADGAAVPLTPEAMAESAAEAVAAGATDIHVHPKTPCGRDTLSPRVLAVTLEAIRARVSVPVGVTTGAWAEPDPAARVERVRGWTVLPDHASVNWHEPGAEEVAAALLDLGVGVEAGIWSGTDGAERFAASSLGPRVLRVLAEVTDTDAGSAVASARGLLSEIGSAHGRPVLLHGEDGGAWPVLRLAGRLGVGARVGLEDVLVLPGGGRARSNAELVLAGLGEYALGRAAGARR
ncbi:MULTISPECIES: 3-keto-5-aminohexanoate cleavage protein [Streptomyces]|uniref:3-keto-5-aminohexanoate cleavage protein n=1 Tax=Streptomyces koelreuteriae TaxID=2838015 RepID=A0ABX8FZT6_9ACTN|nr:MULTISPECIES: 3-keto-5-aminohexanoate cleavage protein [Streptomyces]QWB26621.1 3-keto-5-aminohexanoate cleavage protein [Streptomyces koelreuteriae]UUA09701.1 3-keto-5-aminohexanoate cleavage protein [Streptomyces koelreuteriae]UUA17306.1 3-keto-5-aminohexanoate cleavage protein [Streptomyces sp. CRCS-T-1]